MKKQELFYQLKHDTILNDLMPLKGNTIKVLLALSTFRSFKDGYCYPGRKKLKKITGITSGRRIREALEELVEVGLIEMKVREDKTGTHYTVR